MNWSKSILLTGSVLAVSCGVAEAQTAAADSAAGIAPQGQAATRPQSEAPEDDGHLSDIVVTATRTGETSAQRTPLAVSVFSAERLNSSLVNNVKDLVALTPNLNVAQATSNAQIYIRGIGTNNVFNGSDPDVTVQVDGVYLARAYAQFSDFVDVQRIEVLRGPQGTLYGRNSVGGTLNIISRAPSQTFEAKALLTGGTYGLAQGQAYVSGPIADGVFASLTGNYIRRDSFVDNIGPSHDLNNANRGGVRGQLRFTPDPKLDITLRADWNRVDEYFDSYDHLLAPVAFSPLATSTVGDYSKAAINVDQRNRQTLWGVAGEVNYRLSDAVSLKSLTAYRFGKYDLLNDNDGTEQTVNTTRQFDRSRQFSQEFNLNVDVARFKGVAGLFYFHETENSIATVATPPSAITAPASAVYVVVTPLSKVRSLAAFAQGTYHITDTLGLTIGARYTEDRKSLQQSYVRTSLNPATTGNLLYNFQADVDRTFSAFTPKFGIDWQVAPTVLVYASATRGFKSGGTNYAAASIAALSFNPETIWSYEGGIKSDWFDRRLRVNLTGFKYDYKDLQVQQVLGPGNVAIANAATADVKGLEIEVTGKPAPGLTLGTNLAFLDARYGNFTRASVPGALRPYVAGDPRYSAASGTFNASGNRLNAAPEFSLSASAQYDHDLGHGKAFLRSEFYHQSRVFYDPSNAAISGQKAYDTVNLSIGYNDANAGWGVQVVGKNVLQERYLITIAANGVVPGGIAAAPRTVAIQLSKSW